MYKFRFAKRGAWFRHRGVLYRHPETIETDVRLDLKFKNVFVLISRDFVPKPRRIGRTEPVEMKSLPRNEVRGGDDTTMGLYVTNIQHLDPVPAELLTGANPVDAQRLQIFENDELILDVTIPVGPEGLEPAAEELPRFSALVGATIDKVRTFLSGEHESDPFEESYIQEAIPEPDVEPEPAPEPEPGPEPEPAPVQIASPTSVGTTEAISQVESDSRPVQAKRKISKSSKVLTRSQRQAQRGGLRQSRRK